MGGGPSPRVQLFGGEEPSQSVTSGHVKPRRLVAPLTPVYYLLRQNRHIFVVSLISQHPNPENRCSVENSIQPLP